MKFDRYTTAATLRFEINKIRRCYNLRRYSINRCISYTEVQRLAYITRERLEQNGLNASNKHWWDLMSIEYESHFLAGKYLRHRY